MKRVVTLLCSLGYLLPAFAAAPSPYAGEQSRDIKALSAEEVTAIAAGKGMGLAKAAELNGYPGPSHVLELSNELKLSDVQKRQTEDLFAAMQRRAIELGDALLAEERRLDRAFADKTITLESLAARMSRIGELQAQLRVTHLEAHLQQVSILAPEQVAAYVRLRGYGSHAAVPTTRSHHH